VIKLELTLEETNGIIAALAELPIKTNAMFLIQKIAGQVQPQMPEKEDVAA
jgi:hypothetical protein